MTKIQILHQMNFAHMKLQPNNLYFNYVSNEVFFGPIKLSHEDENDMWYSSPESTFLNLQSQSNEESGHSNTNFEIMYSPKNDLWSIGCIFMEMFFISTPLLQSFSIRDKIRKMIEIIGLPLYEDVCHYVNAKEYNLIAKTYHNKNNEPIIFELMDYKKYRDYRDRDHKHQNKTSSTPYMQELYEIILECLNFNPDKRPTVSTLIKKLRNLEDLSFSYKSKLNTETDQYKVRSRYNNDTNKTDRSSYSRSRSPDKKEPKCLNLPYAKQSQIYNKSPLKVKKHNDEDYDELNTSKSILIVNFFIDYF